MKRKVVLHGPSTLTVSLPSKWARKYNISKGDELDVKEKQNFITIRPQSGHGLRKSSRKISIDLGNTNDENIKCFVDMIYKSGYDEIDITFTKPSQVNIIQSRVNTMLLGYEIVNQRANYLAIRSVSQDQEAEFDRLLRRVFLVTLALANSSFDIIAAGKFSLLKETLLLEQTNNRLTSFCERILNNKKDKDERVVYQYMIVWLLESIGDSYREMIKVMMKRGKIKNPEKTLEMYKKVNRLLKTFHILFYHFSIAELNRIRNEINQINMEFTKLFGKKEQVDFIVLMYLSNIVRQITDCLGSTTGLQLKADPLGEE